MPPKKKNAKNTKNAFYHFMMAVKAEEHKRGNDLGNMKEVADYAGPLWSALTPEEKEPYNLMAARAKKNDSEDLTKKFTSLGVSYAALDAEEREKQESNQIMIETIRTMVRSLKKETDLKTKVFYLCHVNFYYKTEKGYCNAEFALSEFNLECGLKDTLHFFIDPGQMALGYRFEAKDWSEKTHNIPFEDPKWTCGEKDKLKMFDKILSFLKAVTGPIPPIFTMVDSLNNNTSLSAVKSFFTSLCDAANEDPSLFRIYPLPELFFELRNHCVANQDGDIQVNDGCCLPTSAMAENEFEKDIFSYAKNLGCSYHEEKDLSNFCSLAVVTRWVYTICDFCCCHVGISLVLGKHCPKDADVGRNNDAAAWTEIKESAKEARKAASKDANIPFTIVDHGKIREETQALSGKSSGDVRLPQKSLYASAIRQTMAAGPSIMVQPQDFPAIGPPRVSYGRGRGINRPTYSPPKEQPQPVWPISGRGSNPGKN